METDYKLTFSGRFHYKKGGGLSLHGHPDDFQVQLIYHGKAIVGVNNFKFTAKAGDIVFIPQGSEHYFTVISEDGMKTLEIKFTCSDPELLDLISTISTLFRDKNNMIFNRFSSIVMEGYRKLSSYKMKNNAMLVETIIDLSRLCMETQGSEVQNTEPQSSAVATDSAVLDSITEYIYSNLNRNFQIEEMASACGYKQDYIYRTVHKKMQMSVIQYINKIRFEQAKKLIQHSELSMTEIAWNLGFESLQYFSKFFKQHASMSPSEYSKRTRNLIRTDY